MQSNWETFQAAYQAASPDLKAFIDSEEIGNFVESQVIPGKISYELKPEMIIIISDLSLGVISKNELGNCLIEIGIPFENSHTIYSEVISFLTQKGFNLDAKSTMPEAPQPTIFPISSIPQVTQNLASEISATENDLASLQTVRTMSHDMAAIKPGSDVVYQSSSQADILRTPDVGELPNVASATPEATRWDTDTRQ